MAAMNKFFCVLIVFILVSQSLADLQGNVPGGSSQLPSPKIDCGAECTRRCSKTSRRSMCLRACGGCCAKCQCVPPGTAGNLQFCPCYARIRTRGGKPKCP
ncbi:cypmaclein-like [Wolffia australiana]